MNTPEIKALVLSCSLNPHSNSAKLAEAAKQMLDERNVPGELLDLRTIELPLCDGHAAYDHPNTVTVKGSIDAADAILIAAPVYNFDLNAVVKNVIELTGSAWEGKAVGLMCSAGGRNSYMAPIQIANTLMLDFRSHIVPRFVYAVRADFDAGGIDLEVRERLAGLIDASVRLARGLALTA